MVYGLYVIRDVKSVWMTPSIDISDQTAIRNFEHAALNNQSLFRSHAKDFSLYRIGSFDDQTAEIQPCVPVHLMDGTDALAAMLQQEV